MAGLKTQATTRRGPPQRRQVRTSTANVRFNSSAQGSRNRLAAGAGELGAGSGGGGWRGTTSGRRRALGARTPKKRTRLTLGGGMSAASRRRKAVGLRSSSVAPEAEGRFIRVPRYEGVRGVLLGVGRLA